MIWVYQYIAAFVSQYSDILYDTVTIVKVVAGVLNVTDETEEKMRWL